MIEFPFSNRIIEDQSNYAVLSQTILEANPLGTSLTSVAIEQIILNSDLAYAAAFLVWYSEVDRIFALDFRCRLVFSMLINAVCCTLRSLRSQYFVVSFDCLFRYMYFIYLDMYLETMTTILTRASLVYTRQQIYAKVAHACLFG